MIVHHWLYKTKMGRWNDQYCFLQSFELSVFLYGRLKYMYNTGGEGETGRPVQRKINYYNENNMNRNTRNRSILKEVTISIPWFWVIKSLLQTFLQAVQTHNTFIIHPVMTTYLRCNVMLQVIGHSAVYAPLTTCIESMIWRTTPGSGKASEQKAG